TRPRSGSRARVAVASAAAAIAAVAAAAAAIVGEPAHRQREGRQRAPAPLLHPNNLPEVIHGQSPYAADDGEAPSRDGEAAEAAGQARAAPRAQRRQT